MCPPYAFAHSAPIVGFVTRDFHSVGSSFFADPVCDAVEFYLSPVYVEHRGQVPFVGGCEVTGEGTYCHCFAFRLID